MTTISMIVEPFVRRGLFASPEQAVTEMAREYILRQIEYYRSNIEALQAKYSMTYEQFEAYLQSRSATLLRQPHPSLNQAVMAEEEDALDWKIAREMLQSWLGLQAESL
ncbi:MAG: hypothetical protein ACP5J4_00990 [Anaerolineae bacterium]